MLEHHRLHCIDFVVQRHASASASKKHIEFCVCWGSFTAIAWPDSYLPVLPFPCLAPALPCLCAAVANKKLALSLFEFDQGDMGAAAPVVAERLYKKTGDLKWKFMTHEQLVLELPLSTWKRTVRRVYVQRDQQLSKLAAWWAEYITTESAFVAMVAGKPKALVRGGAEGLQKFKQVVANQLELVHQGMLSGKFD